MEYKLLGETGIVVSRLGFGCWAIGGHGYGRQDDSNSIKAIKQALAQGITFFDTADVYGFGHSEEVLSKGLGSQRNKVVIASKFGVSWDDNGRTYFDCRPERIIKALEDSLQRLRVDCIPLYQIHWYDNVTPISDTLDILMKCKEQGKIRSIGCSNFSLSLLEKIVKKYPIEALQCSYNICEREIETETLNYAREFGISIITYNVLARGLLSGKYDMTTVFGEADTRSKDRRFQGEKVKKYLKVLGVLRSLSKNYNRNPSQIAIRWVLQNPDITTVLVGITNPEQIKENIEVFDWSLSEQDFQCLGIAEQRALGNNISLSTA